MQTCPGALSLKPGVDGLTPGARDLGTRVEYPGMVVRDMGTGTTSVDSGTDRR